VACAGFTRLFYYNAGMGSAKRTVVEKRHEKVPKLH
jgi:hypothetical protein